MLQDICEYIHNYFIHETVPATYTVDSGEIIGLPSLKEGQRFLIAGSDLNDGIYTYHTDGIRNDDDIAGAGLADEVFTGAICKLSVPPQLIALAQEAKDWVEKYGDVINSPYQSESFGGYSYSRASRAGGDGGTTSAGWQDVFASRMERWRKVSF